MRRIKVSSSPDWPPRADTVGGAGGAEDGDDRLPNRRQGVHRLSRLRRCRRRQTPGRAGGARGVGQNDYIRKRAEMLAGLGYTAFALDMYGGGQVADHPDSAKAFRQAVMSDLAVAAKRFDAAKAVLRRQPTVDGENVAAIGYCMGGTIVLHMARVGTDLDGVVSYHGGLATDAGATGQGEGAGAGVYRRGRSDGALRPGAGLRRRNAGRRRIPAGRLPGAKHAFTNPEADDLGQRFGMPLAYDKAADAGSWASELSQADFCPLIGSVRTSPMAFSQV